MYEIWTVRDVGCLGYGMLKMCDNQDMGCSGREVLEM